MEGWLARAPRESWYSPKLELRASPIHGRGSFATARIEPGELVEVWGERSEGRRVVVYTDDAAAAQAGRRQGRAVMQWDERLWSIEERGEDTGYFLNHACDANLWLRDPFRLEARRTVERGEELTLDYALFEADECFVAGWACRCGTAACRGQLAGRDWARADVQARYAGHFSPLIERRIHGA